MKTVKFNPYKWLPKTDWQSRPRTNAGPKSTTGIAHDIEVIVSRIESNRLDLTLNYSDWLSIGFSLAAELGESGRDYYHRLSRFHPDYSYQACNLQFDKCLKRGKSGVSIKTLFYLAQSAGIDIRV
ncbi:MAG: PriCT-2 domain-containing protein [Prolixibacteraceae bacterium]|nr:PriCT-2 domain-containing protein [Prolixibacteraceae bacterium]